jgi:hypothetical protein
MRKPEKKQTAKVVCTTNNPDGALKQVGGGYRWPPPDPSILHGDRGEGSSS